MKYFSSFPNITFESTIGNFTISSFFYYYDFDIKKLYLTTTEVDNKTTLTELSQKIYEDDNSMWLFLIANETTDPFQVLSQNTTLYSDRIKNNIVLGLNPASNPSANYVNPIGSIITEYSATGGSAWQYSSIGNFDLDGAFTIVDSTDYYTGKSTIKEQKNGNPFIVVDGSPDSVSIIENNNDVYTTDNQEYNTKNKTTESNNIIYITQNNSGSIYPSDTTYESVPFFTPPPPPSYQNTGSTFAVNNYMNSLSSNKKINVILPSGVSSLINNLKSLSYT